VVDHLQDLGYDPDDSATLAATGSRAKVSADWQLAKQLVVDQYQLGLIAQADAIAHLEGLGYDANEAESILAVADLARHLAAQNAAMGRVKARYLAYKIDRATAQADLQALSIPPDQLELILDEWDLGREANVPTLTPAQWADALYYQVVDQDTAQAGLESLGYQDHDAWVLLSVRNHGPLPNEPQS
jgi:hypothetical protein